MPRYIDADLLTETMRNRYDEICDTYGYHDLYASGYDDAVDAVENAPTADVAPRAEVLEAVDEFKNDLMDVFIGLCGGNDYNRLNLLKIGDTVARVYNKHITELKKKYTEETDTEGGDGTE